MLVAESIGAGLLLEVSIPGSPVGAGRPRVVRLKNGQSHAFMPDKSSSWEASAIGLFRIEWHGRPPLDCGLALEVVAVCPRPQRLCRRSDSQSRLPALCKPDGDNVLKLAQDALVKAGVVQDDTRIVFASVLKLYAAISPAEQPHLEIRLCPYP